VAKPETGTPAPTCARHFEALNRIPIHLRQFLVLASWWVLYQLYSATSGPLNHSALIQYGQTVDIDAAKGRKTKARVNASTKTRCRFEFCEIGRASCRERVS
jgi:hypothetical protein